MEADRHPTAIRGGVDPARRHRKRYLLQRLHVQHAQEGSNTQETYGDAPGTPRVPRPGCRHGGRALHPYRMPYRDAIIRRRIRALAGTGRSRATRALKIENAKLTHNRRLAAGGPRGSAARRVRRGPVTRCAHEGRFKSFITEYSSWLLHISTDMRSANLSMHLRNLIMPCPCCPFDSSTVTRDGGRGTDTRLML